MPHVFVGDLQHVGKAVLLRYRTMRTVPGGGDTLVPCVYTSTLPDNIGFQWLGTHRDLPAWNNEAHRYSARVPTGTARVQCAVQGSGEPDERGMLTIRFGESVVNHYVHAECLQEVPATPSPADVGSKQRHGRRGAAA